MGNKQYCGCACCKTTEEKIIPKEKLFNTEVIHNLSVYGLHYKKREDNENESNKEGIPDNLENHNSKTEPEHIQLLSSIKKTNNNEFSKNSEKEPGIIQSENIVNSKKQSSGISGQNISKFINYQI